jgi:hypothetical protein
MESNTIEGGETRRLESRNASMTTATFNYDDDQQNGQRPEGESAENVAPHEQEQAPHEQEQAPHEQQEAPKNSGRELMRQYYGENTIGDYSMSDNMDHESLLLVSDFNSFCSKRLVSEIRTWFEEQLIVVNSADVTRLHPGMYGDDGCALTNAYINRVAQEAGAIGSDLVSVSDPETHATRLMSYLQKTEGTVSGLDADGIESAGTMRLISIMPLIISALRRGAVLVMDDLDSSLHPMAVMSLINVFHNDGVNKRGAQLVFNTHNPICLGYNLFRRDEVKFVERDR